MENKQYLTPCAIFEKDGKFLLVKKKEKASGLSGWEIPGGRAEFGEDYEQALKNKMKKYFGVEISILKTYGLVHSNMSVDGSMQFWVIPSLCRLKSEDFRLLDKISEVKWFTIGEIRQLAKEGQLIPGDLRILEIMLKEKA